MLTTPITSVRRPSSSVRLRSRHSITFRIALFVTASPDTLLGNCLAASAGGCNRRFPLATRCDPNRNGARSDQQIYRDVQTGVQAANHRQGQCAFSS